MRRGRTPAAIALATLAALVLHGQAAAAPRLPLAFEADHGQAPRGVDFLARGAGYAVGLGRGRARLATNSGGRVRIAPVGGVLRTPRATAPLPGTVNDYAGGDAHEHIPTYARVRYDEVWRGVDMLFHGREGELQYDFEVAPFADPSRIALRFPGTKGLKLTLEGDLVARAGEGTLRIRRPISFQGTKRVPSRFTLDGRTVRIALGSYDRRRPLTIDPTVSYSTLIGGTGSDHVRDIAVAPDGSAYLTGRTSSNPFHGAAGTVLDDAFLLKLNPTGTAVEFATYLSSGGDSTGHGVAIASDGSIWVVGSAGAGYPTMADPRQPTFQGGTSDGFASRFTPAGTMNYSTFLGSTRSDRALSVAAGPANTIYVAGSVALDGGSPANFPYTDGAFGGVLNGFVAKFTGTDYSVAKPWVRTTDIAVNLEGEAFTVSTTSDGGFPTPPAAPGGGVHQPTCGCAQDAYVAKLDSALDVRWGTYLGGPATDGGASIHVDGEDRPLVSGYAGQGFPTTPGVRRRIVDGDSDAFVARLSSDGAKLEMAGLVGGVGADGGPAVENAAADFVVSGRSAIDQDGSWLVAGTTNRELDATPGAPQPANGGNGATDAYLARLSRDGEVIDYATNIGGSLGDQAYAVASDGRNAYVAGRTAGVGFPTTAGAVRTAPSAGDPGDGWITRTDFDGAPVIPTPTPSPTATATATASPPPPPPPPPPPMPICDAGSTRPDCDVPPPAPEQGETFNLARSQGVVKVRVPGSKRFVDVRTTSTIPEGSTIDATRGRAALFAENARNDRNGMVFYDGVFKVTQRETGSAIVTARLAEALDCGRYAKRKRRLWGSGKGRFRTVGKGGSAAVRGTRWLTEDTCRSTLVRVAVGRVEVTDKVTGAVFIVRKGRSVRTPFSLATLRKIQRGGRTAGRLTAKARRKLRRAA